LNSFFHGLRYLRIETMCFLFKQMPAADLESLVSLDEVEYVSGFGSDIFVGVGQH